MSLPTLAELESAARLIYDVMLPTPQYRYPLLDERTGCAVWVKHENHTPAGAFKVRGGIVFFDDLARGPARPRGVVTATRGNHGQSVGLGARRTGLPAAIVVPHGNSVEKNRAMRALGVELIEEGDDFQASVDAATRIAEERGWYRLPSFHPLLVRGVGTWGLELLRAVPELETLYVPIGQGSGICGAIAARNALGRSTEIVGVVSTGAPSYKLSVAAGHPVSHPVTTVLADGMACRSPVPEALEIIARDVARIVAVSDAEVAAAMRALHADTHNVAEGAGAAPLAALLQERERMRGRRVGVVLSGGNVDAEVFGKVLLGMD